MSNDRRSRISIERALECLSYDPETGEFVWKKGQRAGTVAGCKKNDGYIYMKIDQIQVQAANLAWAMHYGVWPDLIVDHIDGDRANNRISNFRLATEVQNRHNTKIRSDNTSGHKGVHYNAASRKWVAAIKCNGKRFNLGNFASPDGAAEAYRQAAIRLHGEFAKPLGIPARVDSEEAR